MKFVGIHMTRIYYQLRNLEYVRDLLYESTSRDVLAPVVNYFYSPKTEHRRVESEREVYENLIRFS